MKYVLSVYLNNVSGDIEGLSKKPNVNKKQIKVGVNLSDLSVEVTSGSPMLLARGPLKFKRN